MCKQYDLIKTTTKNRDFDPGNHRVTQTMGRRETQIAEDMAFQTTCHQAAQQVHLRISVGEEEISSFSLSLPILREPSPFFFLLHSLYRYSTVCHNLSLSHTQTQTQKLTRLYANKTTHKCTPSSICQNVYTISPQ